MVRRLSGVQKEVLACFRRVLRAAIKKDREHLAAKQVDGNSSPRPSAFASLLQTSSSSTFYASKEFRRQAFSTKRSDFKKIEHMLRKADKQIKLLSMPGVKVVSGTSQI